MFSRLRIRLPEYTGDSRRDFDALKAAINTYLVGLEDKGALAIAEYKDVTPVLKFGGATTGITYDSVRGGKARRVEGRAEVSGYFLLTSKGSATGAATIDGLPWASADRSAVTLYMEKVTFANQFQGFLGASGTSVELYESTEAGAVTALADTDFANDSFVMFSVSYYTG
jgi:hypothetical protein